MTKRKDTYGIREMESFAMTEFKPIKEGKVREIYDNGDSLIMVATDRISAFDVILKNKVTNKGKVLTQMSKFWFDYTRDLLPNHMLSVDVKEMPEFFRQPQYEGRSMMCRKPVSYTHLDVYKRQIIDCATGETLYRKQLDAKYVPQLCAFAKEQGVVIITYNKQGVVTESPEDEWALKEMCIRDSP